MLNRFVKIPSVQQEFNAVQRQLTVDIPSYLGVVAPDSSYLEITCRVESTDTSNIGNPNMYWNEGTNKDFHFENCALIRRCQINCDRKGLIESQPRADVINNLRKTYCSSVEELNSKHYLDANQVSTTTQYNRDSIFVDKRKTGSVYSKYVPEARINIPLQEISQFCEVPELDLRKTGDMRLNMELNLNKVHIQDATPLVLGDEVKMEDVSGGDADVSTLVSENQFINLQGSPYYVGQGVEVSATHSVSGAFTVNTQIKSITVESDFSLSLEFEDVIYTNLATGETLTGISLSFNAPTGSYSLIVEGINVVVKQLNKKSSDYDVIEWNEYSVEEGNGNGNTAFQRLFEVEPQVSSIMFLNIEDNNLLPSQHESHQIFVNNIPMTNRLVNDKSPVYYDRLATSWNDQGRVMKNYTENALDSKGQNLETTVDNDNYKTSIVSSICPLTTTMKLVQVNVNKPTGGIGNYILYKCKTRKMDM